MRCHGGAPRWRRVVEPPIFSRQAIQRRLGIIHIGDLETDGNGVWLKDGHRLRHHLRHNLGLFHHGGRRCLCRLRRGIDLLGHIDPWC